MRVKMMGLLAAAASIGAIQVASAADLPVKAPTPAAVVAYNWSGFYGGFHIGGGWTDADWLRLSGSSNGFDTGPGSIANATGVSHDMSGVLGGGQVGFLWQTGSFVFGAEASFSGSGIEGRSVGGVDDVYRTKLEWLFLATARLGLAADRWLVYAKGGYAAGSIAMSIFDPTPGDDQASSRKTHSGWTAGGGFEYALGQNWTAGIEYNYISLGDKDHAFINTPSGLANVVNVDLGAIHTIWARMNYKFGGPVVASR